MWTRLFSQLMALFKPKPRPTIQAAGTIDLNEMSSILLDKLEAMKDPLADIHLPDAACKVYDKDEVVRFLGLDETDKIVYVPEKMDCDDFARRLFGEFASLVWTNAHALNWFVDKEGKLWFIEPQSDQIAPDLAGWQGWDIRFFLGA